MHKSALVLGSSGLVGNEVLQLLLANNAYHNVIVINRKPTSIVHPKLIEYITDFKDFRFIDDIIPVHSIFSCLGTTKKKTPDLEAYKHIETTIPVTFARRFTIKGSLQAFHYISAVGANASSNNFYTKLKGESEGALEELKLNQLCIYRPAMIIGERQEKRILEKMIGKVSPFIDKLLKDKSLQYHSIEASQLAKSMLYYDLNMPILGNHIFTYEDMKLGF